MNPFGSVYVNPFGYLIPNGSHTLIPTAPTPDPNYASILSNNSAEDTWRAVFRAQVSLFGVEAASSFARVKRLWTRLDTFLTNRAPAVFNMLSPPLSEREAQILDQQCASLQLSSSVRVPIEWRTSVKLHNGFVSSLTQCYLKHTVSIM
jgi:hypothetical protein